MIYCSKCFLLNVTILLNVTLVVNGSFFFERDYVINRAICLRVASAVVPCQHVRNKSPHYNCSGGLRGSECNQLQNRRISGRAVRSAAVLVVGGV